MLERLALSNSCSKAEIQNGTFQKILSDPIIPDNSLKSPNSKANSAHKLDNAFVLAQAFAQQLSNLRNNREKKKSAAHLVLSWLSNSSRQLTPSPIAMVLNRPASKQKVQITEHAVKNTPSKCMQIATKHVD